jgi:uncharacterized cofD-like protein
MVGMDAPYEGLTLEALKDEESKARNNYLLPTTESRRPTRIVCVGGGTGLPTVLKALARKATPFGSDPGIDVTAVVAMSDDGGSSGKLRRSQGMLPPGDVRNCLVALAGKTPLTELFQHRFGNGKGLQGHAVGNLLIAALAELKGDFLEAVKVSSQLLGARGTVLPCTVAPVQLVADLADDTRVIGERNIVRNVLKTRGRVVKVSLLPERPEPSEGILEAIRTADLIAIGPGSLYSSVIPNLLVKGVSEALQQTRALKVLVSNLMTQPGETEGMSCTDHVKAVLDHAGPVLDAVLVNLAEPCPELAARYARKGSVPVKAKRRELIDLGVIPIEADLLKEGNRIRHDGRKVSRCLMKLARVGL